jgi:hypothetical protein
LKNEDALITFPEFIGSSGLQSVESRRGELLRLPSVIIPARKEDSMKRHRFDPIEVLRSHQTTLRERLEEAADPEHKRLVEKRLRNLDEVIQFLTTTRGASGPIGVEGILDQTVAAATRAPATGPSQDSAANQQHWRLPIGTSCGNV